MVNPERWKTARKSLRRLTGPMRLLPRPFSKRSFSAKASPVWALAAYATILNGIDPDWASCKHAERFSSDFPSTLRRKPMIFSAEELNW